MVSKPLSNDTTSSSSSTFGLASTYSMADLNHSLPVKLDPNNFLLRKMQIENVIIAHGLEGSIDGTNQCPSQFLIHEEKSTLNPL